MNTITLIEEGRAHSLTASRDGSALRIPPEEVEAALGWSLEAEGLCRGDVCVPTARTPDFASDAGIDLHAFADLLSRPLVVDEEEGVASIGASARDQTAILASGEAPDFTLPDLAGREHTLSDYRGKKVLLIAYASW
jgi:hypothetical protein